MGWDDLQPGNTLRAKATTLAAYTRILKGEDVEKEYSINCSEAVTSGMISICVMNKCGKMYIALNEYR